MNKVFCSWLYTVQPKRITDRPETPSYEESDVLRLQEVRVTAPSGFSDLVTYTKSHS